MPNRIIKESICTSENIDVLSSDAEILFYRLIVNADDFGIVEGRTSIVLAKCFPLKIHKITMEQLETWLKELSTQNLILLYVVNSKRYIKLLSWEKRQRVRAKRKKYPLPQLDSNSLTDDSNSLPNDRYNPIQSNPENQSIGIQSNDNLLTDDRQVTAISQLSPKECKELVDFWNDLNITSTKTSTLHVPVIVKDMLTEAVKIFTHDGLTKAMSNYKQILEGQDYYWSYRWSLVEFLEKGVEKFMDSSKPFEQFRTKSKKSGKKTYKNKTLGKVDETI